MKENLVERSQDILLAPIRLVERLNNRYGSDNVFLAGSAILICVGLLAIDNSIDYNQNPAVIRNALESFLGSLVLLAGGVGITEVAAPALDDLAQRIFYRPNNP